MSEQTEIELHGISHMLKNAKEHNLQVECVWSLIHEIINKAKECENVTSESIADSCEHALLQWDI